MNARLMTFVVAMTTAAIPAQGGGATFEAVDGQFGNAFAQAISGDGRTIGGGIIGPLYYAPGPTFWNEPQTPVGVTTYNGGEVGFIRALTPDGRFGVGLIRYDPIVQAYGPFLWDLVLRQTHPLPKTASNPSDAAYGINHDGSVIVGRNVHRAVAWIGGNLPIQLLPGQTSTAIGVSADGSRIVGYFGPDSQVSAFLWSAATGAVQLPSPVPGSTHDRALAITPDGSTIVGYSGNRWDTGSLVRWELGADGAVASAAVLSPAGICYSAGDVLNNEGLFSAAVSADGSVIGGTIDGRALIWTEGHGLLDLTSVYHDTVPPTEDQSYTQPYAVKGISADGRTLVGLSIGDYGFQSHASWKLTLPPRCDADANFDGVSDTRDIVRLLGAFGQTVPFGTRGDSNGDGTVDTSDLVRLLAGFGQACPL